MEMISHRVNDLSTLQKLDPSYGAEIDIRSAGGQLILAHEPFAAGVSVDEFLQRYAKTHSKALLILNPKEDGLEDLLLEKVRSHGIERFFFLDLTLPTLVRLAVRKNEKRAAVRVSEYEPEEATRRLAGIVEWVWLDCFTGEPPQTELIRRLRHSFKVCLVSPELQGYASERITAFRPLAPEIDAVCTKFPALWS